MNRQQLIQSLLAQGGIMLRQDSNETALLDRELRHIEATVYRQDYPTLEADSFFPVDSSDPEWAEEIEYKTYDVKGEAKAIANYADDLPKAEVLVTSEMMKVQPFGNSFEYSVQDLQRALAPGAPRLDQERGLAARQVLETKRDEVACFGYPALKIRGGLNNEYVDIIQSAANGTSSSRLWSAKTAANIIADMNAVKAYVPNNTLAIYRINTIVLPTSLYELIESMPYSEHSDKTVLQWWKGNNPNIDVRPWARCNTASAASAGRIMGYFKDKSVIKQKVPQGFRVMPPQAKNLAWIQNCWLRTGGVHIRVPKSAVYMDSAAA
jgi:hypothetical protein